MFGSHPVTVVSRPHSHPFGLHFGSARPSLRSLFSRRPPLPVLCRKQNRNRGTWPLLHDPSCLFLHCTENKKRQGRTCFDCLRTPATISIIDLLLPLRQAKNLPSPPDSEIKITLREPTYLAHKNHVRIAPQGPQTEEPGGLPTGI